MNNINEYNLSIKYLSVILIVLWSMATACAQAEREVDTVIVGDDTYQVEWKLRESFDEGWEDRWVLEGDSCYISVLDNKLYVNDYMGATIWNVEEYPANILVRLKVIGLDRTDTKTNFNIITHGRENDGSPLVIGPESGRTGAYKPYHDFPNHIATFVYKWTRVRRDPGFNLLSDVQEVASKTNTEYEIVFAVNEERLIYYINGVKHHEVPNEHPLPGGKFGIRTWNTLAFWYDIEIGELIK
ncbi:hypothetical protein [Sinomicrobium weinanense]|uniref:DUF1080 domain-containing protein n=1 Tax=Sinomicrobium weinanense TaxID=2842200 RepID=A0A926JTW2_9FLAO|nr:hypothetical protein [Sinomicrobium weinanense]MBC9797234.1 hypothetical protein [Sinomicrobium weinanense]MBU3125553.1 hypothetical protein [Sinomicrobium weinanense]